MKSKLRNTIENVLIVAVLLAVVVGIASMVNYRIDLYKRKYPGTTTLDYWLDSHK